jgi:hypothetical protein
VQDTKVAPANKLNANALYLMNLRDKLPPKGQVLLTTLVKRLLPAKRLKRRQRAERQKSEGAGGQKELS